MSHSSQSNSTVKNFPALTGFYKALFLYIEPCKYIGTIWCRLLSNKKNCTPHGRSILVSTILPAVLIWFQPGENWFHHQLIPSAHPAPVDGLDARTRMVVWQLGNCVSVSSYNINDHTDRFSSTLLDKCCHIIGYLLLGLISSIVFRAVRDALPKDPVSQERIVGASLTALALADVSFVLSMSKNYLVLTITIALSGIPVRILLTCTIIGSGLIILS